MNRHLFAASVLSTAIGLAMAMQAQPTAARAESQPATEAYIIPLLRTATSRRGFRLA
jgi:hypothetical protein